MTIISTLRKFCPDIYFIYSAFYRDVRFLRTDSPSDRAGLGIRRWADFAKKYPVMFNEIIQIENKWIEEL